MFTQLRTAASTVVVTCFIVASLEPALVAQRGGAHPDAKEIGAYRLTMDAVHKAAAATRAMVGEMKKDPRVQEMAKVEAEIKALEKKDELTEAEEAKLEKLEAKREQLSDALDGLSWNNATTLSEMEAKIKGYPPLANGLRSAGMTPREYATFTLAILQASLAAGFKKSGMVKELPKDVPAENVKFVEEHEAELKKIQKSLEELQAGK